MYPLWDTTIPQIAGKPFVPKVEVPDMPCMCPVSQDRKPGEIADICIYTIVNINDDGSEGTYTDRLYGRLIYTKSGGKTYYAVGTRRGKIVRAEGDITLLDPGKYRLKLMIKCPMPNDMPILHPGGAAEPFERQARWDITAVAAPTAKYSGSTFDCENFLRQADSLPDWSAGHRELKCMYELCLQNGHLPGTPEYHECHR
jgi:hypothetical protein